MKTSQKNLDAVLGTSAIDILAINEDRNASLFICGNLRLLQGVNPGRLVSMSFTEKFARQPRALIAGQMAARPGDCSARVDYHFSILLASFCSVPIFVLAWFCGKKWGIAAAASASLVWWYVNWSTGDPILKARAERGRRRGALDSFYRGFGRLCLAHEKRYRCEAHCSFGTRFTTLGTRDSEYQRGRTAPHWPRFARRTLPISRGDRLAAPAHCVMIWKNWKSAPRPILRMNW